MVSESLLGPVVAYTVAFLCAVAAALWGVEARRPRLFALAKPVATLLLLGIAWGPAPARFAVLVAAGIILSAAGDIALLLDEVEGGGGGVGGPAGASATAPSLGLRRAFMAGLAFFLLAHVLYTAAFLTGGGAAAVWWSPFVGAALFAGSSGFLLRRLWGALDPVARGPIVFYAAAITVMVAAALSLLVAPGPLAVGAAAAAGAVLFYLSDGVLAWNRFVRASAHGQTVTLALYWAGQLGIALAARLAARS